MLTTENFLAGEIPILTLEFAERPDEEARADQEKQRWPPEGQPGGCSDSTGLQYQPEYGRSPSVLA